MTELPETYDGQEVAREIARRAFVLVRNEDRTLPLAPTGTVALIGAAARDARVLGGGSATVFPERVVSPLDGLTAALPDGSLTYALGADPTDELTAADQGFTLRAVVRDESGTELGTLSAPSGQVQWFNTDLPEGVVFADVHSVELTGTFTPRVTGEHAFGTRGFGRFRFAVDGQELSDDKRVLAPGADPFEAFFGTPVEIARVALEEGTQIEVSLFHELAKMPNAPIEAIGFTFAHREPRRDADELIVEAALAAGAADTAVVVVATTERVESEGFDRTDLRLPGRQDDLVRAVAAANPNTVVVVNAGSPVELPWREDVAAVLLSWFPGQEGGAALADVLLGAEEPGGRLPTTWGALADAPVTEVTPVDGEVPYTEGLFIGYRAWEKSGATPRTPSATASATPTGRTTPWRRRPALPRSASPTPVRAPAARSSRSISPSPRKTGWSARPAAWPASRASRPRPGRASRCASNCRTAPSRSGTRPSTPGLSSPVRTRSRRPTRSPTSA